jgi:hypothetical protein
MTDPVVSPARSWSAEIALKIQFYDLDPMQVVWHGNYARYFEQARCALLDSIGYNYPEMKASGYAWPVIDMQAFPSQPPGQDVIAEIVGNTGCACSISFGMPAPRCDSPKARRCRWRSVSSRN